MHDVVVVALASPLLVGVYENGVLIERIESDRQSSEALSEIFEPLLKRYEIANLIYAKGPGSFMAIKVTYIFLKTLCIVKGCHFLATDAFFFNQNRPIKAIGKLCFVKTSESIITRQFDEVPPSRFELPSAIALDDFESDTLPYYGIGAVG